MIRFNISAPKCYNHYYNTTTPSESNVARGVMQEKSLGSTIEELKKVPFVCSGREVLEYMRFGPDGAPRPEIIPPELYNMRSFGNFGGMDDVDETFKINKPLSKLRSNKGDNNAEESSMFMFGGESDDASSTNRTNPNLILASQIASLSADLSLPSYYRDARRYSDTVQDFSNEIILIIEDLTYVNSVFMDDLDFCTALWSFAEENVKEGGFDQGPEVLQIKNLLNLR